jgi:hypothetical protein
MNAKYNGPKLLVFDSVFVQNQQKTGMKKMPMPMPEPVRCRNKGPGPVPECSVTTLEMTDAEVQMPNYDHFRQTSPKPILLI